MRVQQELDETKVVMHKTIESVLERGEKLDNLVERSNALSAQSKMFYKTAKKQNSCGCGLFCYDPSKRLTNTIQAALFLNPSCSDTSSLFVIIHIIIHMYTHFTLMCPVYWLDWVNESLNEQEQSALDRQYASSSLHSRHR